MVTGDILWRGAESVARAGRDVGISFRCEEVRQNDARYEPKGEEHQHTGVRPLSLVLDLSLIRLNSHTFYKSVECYT